MREVVINGRFLTQGLSGVQRYAREIVFALDKALENNPGSPRFTLAMPSEPVDDFAVQLNHIKSEVIAPLTGHAWEQITLGWRARDAVLVGLCGSGPVYHRRQLVVIHDAAVFRYPGHFSQSYAWFHRLIGHLLAHRAAIGTVSHFSQGELAALLRRPPSSIAIIPNGSEHLEEAEDESVIRILGLAGSKFFLSVGNQAPNKNIGFALKAFAAAKFDPTVKFVVVGSGNRSVFGVSRFDSIPGVILAGRVSDAALTALYRRATAFVFPSIYEGFGIPLLEALSNGCNILASDIPASREVCGDTATYFSINGLDELRQLLIEAIGDTFPRRVAGDLRERVVNSYSWDESARLLLTQLSNLE